MDGQLHLLTAAGQGTERHHEGVLAAHAEEQVTAAAAEVTDST